MFYHVLSMKSKSQVLPKLKKRGFTQRCEHQQAGSLGATFGSIHHNGINNG